MSWHYLQETSSDTIVRAAAMFDRVHDEMVTDFVIIDKSAPDHFTHIVISASGDEILNEEVLWSCWHDFEQTGSIPARIIAEEETALSCDLYGFETERQDILRAFKQSPAQLLGDHRQLLNNPLAPRKSSYPGELLEDIQFCLATGWLDFIAETCDYADFSAWYDDATIFHPAFPYLYDLAAGHADGLSDGKTFDDELTHALSALFSCFIQH